jgi:hypothetical protein
LSTVKAASGERLLLSANLTSSLSTKAWYRLSWVCERKHQRMKSFFCRLERVSSPACGGGLLAPGAVEGREGDDEEEDGDEDDGEDEDDDGEDDEDDEEDDEDDDDNDEDDEEDVVTVEGM